MFDLLCYFKTPLIIMIICSTAKLHKICTYPFIITNSLSVCTSCNCRFVLFLLFRLRYNIYVCVSLGKERLIWQGSDMRFIFEFSPVIDRLIYGNDVLLFCRLCIYIYICGCVVCKFHFS
jgi:hypothetical protein